MVHEALGDYDAADACYDAILAKAPAHEGAHKRKIALLRCDAADVVLLTWRDPTSTRTSHHTR
jgi:hypothetical protein